MDAARLIDALDRFAQVLPAVVAAVSVEDARWRPADGAWSVVEIVRHMGDEEVEDFRARVRLTLEDPTTPWPPIDPEGWAVERRYREASLPTAVEQFVAERRASVAWLRSLRGPDWSRAHAHPKGMTIRAGDLLASWAAHDALHLAPDRQAAAPACRSRRRRVFDAVRRRMVRLNGVPPPREAAGLAPRGRTAWMRRVMV